MPSILVLDQDDALCEALVHAAGRLEPEIAACHQTARAAAELAKGHVRVLVVGPSCLTPGGIRFLHRTRRERPDLVTLLMTGRDAPDMPLRDLVRIGASDLVRFPAAAKTLSSALERAVGMAGVTAPAGRREATGQAFTITSPTGGSGKTFFATNLAYELAVRSGRRVAVVDLDLQFGEVNTALRLRPEATIHDLLEATGGDGDALRSQFRDFVARHSSGIEVLAAPGDPAQADHVSSPHITQVVQVAKELYHYVIVDTPAALTEAVLAAFDLSEGLVVLATLDVPSVKNLGVFLSTLERLKIPDQGVSLVLNKAESDVGLSPAEVQRLFRQDFRGVLPYAKEASRSFNTGRPLLEWARGSAIGRALAATIRRVLPDEVTLGPGPEPTEGEAAPRRSLARLVARLVGA